MTVKVQQAKCKFGQISLKLVVVIVNKLKSIDRIRPGFEKKYYM